jgi:hypothetical protein
MSDETTPPDPFESPEYKCYREDLAAEKTSRLEVFKVFASHSLAISGGLIGAIGYLLKEFSGLAHVWLLLLAVLVATVSLVAALFELVFSQIASTHLEKKLSDSYSERDVTEVTFRLKHYRKWCTGLLYAIPWLILGAVLTVCIFLSINLPQFNQGAKQMTDKPKPEPVIKHIVTETTEKPKPNVPLERQITHIVTDAPEKPKGGPVVPADQQRGQQRESNPKK